MSAVAPDADCRRLDQSDLTRRSLFVPGKDADTDRRALLGVERR